MDGDLPDAIEGQAVTLVLDDEVEVSRGNMLVPPDARPHVADQFAANVVWFDENALMPGRSYYPAHRDRSGQRHRHRR